MPKTIEEHKLEQRAGWLQFFLIKACIWLVVITWAGISVSIERDRLQRDVRYFESLPGCNPY